MLLVILESRTKRDDKNLLKKYNINFEENENKLFCDETTKTDKKLAYEFYENNTNINEEINYGTLQPLYGESNSYEEYKKTNY